MLCRVKTILWVLMITLLGMSCGYLDATKQRVEERKDDGSALPDRYLNTCLLYTSDAADES